MQINAVQSSIHINFNPMFYFDIMSCIFVITTIIIYLFQSKVNWI